MVKQAQEKQQSIVSASHSFCIGKFGTGPIASRLLKTLYYTGATRTVKAPGQLRYGLVCYMGGNAHKVSFG